jgi:hypothetical protein
MVGRHRESGCYVIWSLRQCSFQSDVLNLDGQSNYSKQKPRQWLMAYIDISGEQFQYEVCLYSLEGGSRFRRAIALFALTSIRSADTFARGANPRENWRLLIDRTNCSLGLIVDQSDRCATDLWLSRTTFAGPAVRCTVHTCYIWT